MAGPWKHRRESSLQAYLGHTAAVGDAPRYRSPPECVEMGATVASGTLSAFQVRYSPEIGARQSVARCHGCCYQHVVDHKHGVDLAALDPCTSPQEK